MTKQELIAAQDAPPAKCERCKGTGWVHDGAPESRGEVGCSACRRTGIAPPVSSETAANLTAPPGLYGPMPDTASVQCDPPAVTPWLSPEDIAEIGKGLTAATARYQQILADSKPHGLSSSETDEQPLKEGDVIYTALGPGVVIAAPGPCGTFPVALGNTQQPDAAGEPGTKYPSGGNGQWRFTHAAGRRFYIIAPDGREELLTQGRIKATSRRALTLTNALRVVCELLNATAAVTGGGGGK